MTRKDIRAMGRAPEDLGHKYARVFQQGQAIRQALEEIEKNRPPRAGSTDYYVLRALQRETAEMCLRVQLALNFKVLPEMKHPFSVVDCLLFVMEDDDEPTESE